MKDWWIALWEGEDLTEIMIIVGLIGLCVTEILAFKKNELALLVCGGLLRHLMGGKKNGNGKPAP